MRLLLHKDRLRSTQDESSIEQKFLPDLSFLGSAQYPYNECGIELSDVGNVMRL